MMTFGTFRVVVPMATVVRVKFPLNVSCPRVSAGVPHCSIVELADTVIGLE